MQNYSEKYMLVVYICILGVARLLATAILFGLVTTGALDEGNSKKVVRLLHTLQEVYGITVLFVTHNVQIAETADRVITMKDGLFLENHVRLPIRLQKLFRHPEDSLFALLCENPLLFFDTIFRNELQHYVYYGVFPNAE